MAFGKDPTLLGGVAPFGGNAAQKAHAALNQPKYTSGSKRPYWADSFSPTKVGTDLVRLIPGQYRVPRVTKEGLLYEEEVPWYEYVEHFHGTNKFGAICSGGPYRKDRKKREECYGCEMFWEDYQKRKEIAREKGVKRVDNPKRVNMSDKFAFSIVDLGMFFKKDRVNNQGVVEMNSKTNLPYYDWAKLRNPQDPSAYGKDMKQGRLLPWSVSKTWFKIINAFADKIGQSCAGCGNKDCLQWVAWQCGNPDCGMPLIRANSCTYNDEQLQELTRQACMCHHCGIVSYMMEIVQCNHCVNARRAGIYDVDLEVSQAKDSNNSAILVISGWSQPKPIDPVYQELYKPLDLPSRYSPTPLEAQAKGFGYAPAGQQPMQQQAPPQQFVQQYGQVPQQPVQQPAQQFVQQPAQAPQQPMQTQGFYPQGGGQQGQ